ncbi:MAG: DUF4982 domain-containing protein [Kiritimatiellaeota bacterium]|nr:DUF4982 domain-containing protein [Kiritimatiellota bacterium]
MNRCLTSGTLAILWLAPLQAAEIHVAVTGNDANRKELEPRLAVSRPVSQTMGIEPNVGAVTADAARQRIRLNLDWRFHRGEVPVTNTATGKSAVTQWRYMAVDASAVDAAQRSAPELDMSGDAWKDAKIGEDVFKNRSGFCWFRAILPKVAGDEPVVHFAGVDDNATVYLNGKKLDSHQGYGQPFDVELKAAWKPNGPNVLGVLVENTQGMGGIIGTVEVAPGNEAAGPARPDFDDSSWRKVDLPHDWSIEGPFIEKGSRDTAFLPGGAGWYRKTFAAPQEWSGKVVTILFDGVQERSEVWINGRRLGFHHYGYTAFAYDLTPCLHLGGRNVLAVKAVNELKSRWYPGSGINREVELIVTGKAHVDTWGTYVTTPQVSAESATVAVKTTVKNEDAAEKHVMLLSRIVNAQGKTVSQAESTQKIPAGKVVEFSQQTTVDKPRLWSCETPNLYQVLTTVSCDGRATDEQATSFGIRSLKFEPNKGLLLNGQSVKLKGVNLHGDNGILGAEGFAWAEERRLRLMKEMGGNAIRCSHNPPSTAFLDACDRLGMLVVDEAFDEWKHGKRGGYSSVFDKYWQDDMTRMIRRDRNHPSVIMWSMGNECPNQGFPDGEETVKMLAEFTRKLDPTRATTYGAQPGNMFRFPTAEFWAALDVCGYNYEHMTRGNGGGYVESHEKFPNRLMFGSESQMIMLHPYWRMVMANDYVLGDCVWTGMDYLGEVGTGESLGAHKDFPGYLANSGSYDICGFPKAHSYYRKLVWTMGRDGTVAPTVAMVVRRKHSGTKVGWYQSDWGWMPAINSWTWPEEPNKMWVDVYSGCDEVELFLNGKSLGKKKFSKDEHCKQINTWEVQYEPGELKAVGYKDGKQVADHALKSAAKPAKVKLTADRTQLRADGCDVAFVTVEVADANGNWNSMADNKVSFKVSGAATIAAVGNSNPVADLQHDYHGTTATVYDGRCLLVVRSTGKPGPITITATCDGLEQGTATINSELMKPGTAP